MRASQACRHRTHSMRQCPDLLPSVQGEVEQISMMKPIAQGPHDTGLLEYLEDIIGTDKYKPQLEEGSKK